MKDERMIADAEFRLQVNLLMVEHKDLAWYHGAQRAIFADRLARIDEAARLRALLKECLTALLIETIGSTERRSPAGEIEPLIAAIRAELGP